MGSQRTTPPQTDIFWANLGLEPNLMMVGAALEGCSLPFALRQEMGWWQGAISNFVVRKVAVN